MISQLAFTSTCRPTSTKHRYLWRGCRLWHDGSLIPQERDHRWIALASKAYGISAICLLLYVDYGRDSTLLATLIHVSRKVRQVVHSENSNLLECVGPLTQFDIRHTPGLQHAFCALWNELVEEAKKRGVRSMPVYILRSLTSSAARHPSFRLLARSDHAPPIPPPGD